MAETKYPLSLVIRAVDRATGPLRHITERLARLNAPAKALRQQMGALGGELGVPKLSAGFAGIAGAVSNVGAALGQMRNRLAGVAMGGVGLAAVFKTQFVDTADTFERLELGLEAIEGSAAGAEKALEFIKELTVKTPFELDDVARSFKVMRAMGMDPMNGQMAAIADQVAKIGGTGDDLFEISRQFSQAFSKQKLQAADIKVIAERGVPVWAMLARGVERVSKGTRKISTAELMKLSEAGQLGTKAVELLVEQMGLESEGASARMSRTWSGMMSQLSDQWTFFKRAIMRSGALDWLKGRLSALLAKIDEMDKSGALKRLAQLWGERLVRGFEALAAELPKVWEGLKSVGRTLSWVADLFGGWGNLIMGGLALYIAGPLVSALVGLAGAFGSLGLAIGATPLGIVAAALAAIAAGAGLVVVSFASLTSEERQAAWAHIAEGVAKLRAELDALSIALGGSGEGFKETAQFISAFFTLAVRRAIDDLTAAVKLVRWLASAGKFLNKGLAYHPTVAVGRGFGDALTGRTTPLPWEANRPALAPAVPPPAGQAGKARVQVDFGNMPRGTRVTPDTFNTAEVDLTLGWSMVTP